MNRFFTFLTASRFSAFFDQKLFRVFESLRIGYICGGKLYDDIAAYVGSTDKAFWGCYENRDQVWNDVDFGNRRGNWNRFRRGIFCRPTYEDKQMLLNFARPDTVIYTNVGMGERIDEGLRKAGMEKMLTPQEIIQAHHGRGCDELVHRALKDFSSEQLPLKRFYQTAAFYYTMLIAFFLYEAFKEDMCAPVIRISSCATTLRRRILDIAGKIVNHAGKVTLKITISTWENLNFYQLLLNSENSIQIYRT